MVHIDFLLQDALGPDLATWRTRLREQTVPGFQVPLTVFFEILEEASMASLKEHEEGLSTLESVPVVPYGGEVEESLGPGVWTDGLHIWVAHSTAADLRRRELDDPETTDTLGHALLKAAAFLRSVRQSADEGTLPRTEMSSKARDSGVDFRDWSEVRGQLRALPDIDALVSAWPEADWSVEQVHRFQKTIPEHQPHLEQAVADLMALPLAEQHSVIGATGGQIPPLSAMGARIGRWMTDYVERRVKAAAPDVPDLLTMWTLQWAAPPLGAAARLAKAMDSLPKETQEAYQEGRVERRQIVWDKCGTPASSAHWSVFRGCQPHGAVNYDGGYPSLRWARVTAALLDSTPQTEEEDLARWYRAFLDREWRSPGKQKAWSSLLPPDPAWRGAARWWEGSIKKEGFRFLVAQGQPVSGKSQLGHGAIPPLHRAMISSDEPLVKRLLAQGVSASTVDDRGETALFVSPSGPLTQLLIDAGVDVNQRARNGSTALHAAFRKNEKKNSPQELKLVQLLAAGADPHLTTKTGGTVLHSLMASEIEPHGAARLRTLLAAGVDPFALDKKGRCAIALAWQKPPQTFKRNWFALWMEHPALRPGQLPFDQAESLYRRLKATPEGVAENPSKNRPPHASLLEAWWTEHLNLHRLEGVMAPAEPTSPRRNRM